MSLSKVHEKNLKEMVFAIRDCLKAERQLPALILMYSLIDSLSWAASDQSNSKTRERFESWVNQWLLPNMAKTTPQVTATDLYAARCALLHTGTGISDLAKSKKARRLVYAWGTANTRTLEGMIMLTQSQEEYAALHCEKFFSALRKALKNFLTSADNDSQLAARLNEAASVQYDNVPT